MYLKSSFYCLFFILTLFKIGFSQSLNPVDIVINVDGKVYNRLDTTIRFKRKKFRHIEFRVLDERYKIVAFYMRSEPDLGAGDMIASVLIIGNRIDKKFSKIFKKRHYGVLKTSKGLQVIKFYVLDQLTSEIIIPNYGMVIRWRGTVSD